MFSHLLEVAWDQRGRLAIKGPHRGLCHEVAQSRFSRVPTLRSPQILRLKSVSFTLIK